MTKTVLNAALAAGNAKQRLLHFLPMFLLLTGSVFAQTTWDGSESSEWDNAGNWSAGVPDATDDVVIPNVATAPVIENGTTALAMSVLVESDASLTISAESSLTINGSVAYTSPFNFTAGLNNQGIITNNGNLIIGSVSSVGSFGIINQATFNNNADAEIHIDRSTDTGVYCAAGTFTNAGKMVIGPVENVGLHGIWNDAVFTNNTGGDIHIDRSSARALVNNADELKSINATFNNAADITLGAITSVGTAGIRNLAIFNNKTGGNIKIDNTSDYGIHHAGGTFTNEAMIAIGATTSIGTRGLINEGVFDNKTGGNLQIDRSTDAAISHTSGTFNNEATITIGAVANVGTTGIQSQSAFNNNAGGDIRINRSSDIALNTTAGIFTNKADITIGELASVGTYGIVNRTEFNNTNGHIRIDQSTDTGLYHSSGTFTNAAAITIGKTSSTGVNGIFNEGIFNNNAGGDIRIDRSTSSAVRNFQNTFTNGGSITMGAIYYVGDYGIRNQAVFENSIGGQINIEWSHDGIFSQIGTFINAGTVSIGSANGVMLMLTRTSSGRFNNNTNGVLKGTGTIMPLALVNAGGILSPGFSPGQLTFNDNQDFSNSVMQMEINGTGTAGVDFDRISVTGTATIGGTLALSFNYAPADGDEVTILSATTVSGTFSSVTGLYPGWVLAYTGTAVQLRYDASLPVRLVAFNVRAAGRAAQLQWRTASEIDNAGFYIERSGNGLTWNDIGFVDGHATTSEAQDYVFRDDNPLTGINYYRLRQTDMDGKTDHSRVQTLRFENPDEDLVVWADDTRRGHIKTNQSIEKVTVFDLSGRIMATSKDSRLDLSRLSSGLLLVQVQTNLGTVTKKLVLR